MAWASHVGAPNPDHASPATAKCAARSDGQGHGDEAADRPQIPEIHPEVSPPLPPLVEIGLGGRERLAVAREADDLAPELDRLSFYRATHAEALVAQPLGQGGVDGAPGPE